MNFIKKIFGSGNSERESFSLDDEQLGHFSAIHKSEENITWKGSMDLYGEEVELFIHGDENSLDANQKSAVMGLMAEPDKREAEINKLLKQNYEEAGKNYSKWQDHFTGVSVAANATELEIVMEEALSFYQFNIRVINGLAVDVSIDS